MQQKEGDWVSLLMETRLKENVGIQSTFSKIRVEDNWTVPMWVTLATSPLGNLIEIWITDVIDVKNLSNWTIWSVALQSKI